MRTGAKVDLCRAFLDTEYFTDVSMDMQIRQKCAEFPSDEEDQQEIEQTIILDVSKYF